MDKDNRVRDLVVEATIDAIKGTRRAFVVVSGVAGVGFFDLFLWHFSWSRARVDGRVGAATAMEAQATSADPNLARQLREAAVQLRSEASALSKQRAESTVQIPVIGQDIYVTDVSVALMLVATACLLWTLMYQRRVTECLRAVTKHAGLSTLMPLMRYHFVLIGEQGSHSTKMAARILTYSLPALGVSFLISDLWDLWWVFWDDVAGLSFSSVAFSLRVGFRVLVDASLAIVVWVLGTKCWSEMLSAEKELLALYKPVDQATMDSP